MKYENILITQYVNYIIMTYDKIQMEYKIVGRIRWFAVLRL